MLSKHVSTCNIHKKNFSWLVILFYYCDNEPYLQTKYKTCSGCRVEEIKLKKKEKSLKKSCDSEQNKTTTFFSTKAVFTIYWVALWLCKLGFVLCWIYFPVFVLWLLFLFHLLDFSSLMYINKNILNILYYYTFKKGTHVWKIIFLWVQALLCIHNYINKVVFH